MTGALLCMTGMPPICGESLQEARNFMAKIKTIDHVSIMTEHIKRANFRVKDNPIPEGREPASPKNYT